MKLYIISSIVLLSIIASTLSLKCSESCIPSEDYGGNNGGVGTWCMLADQKQKENCLKHKDLKSCNGKSNHCAWSEIEGSKPQCLSFCQACCSAVDEDECESDDSAGTIDERCGELDEDLEDEDRKRKLRKLRKMRKLRKLRKF